MVKLCAIQLCSSTNVDDNLLVIRRYLAQVDSAQPCIVVLPECCLFFGGKDAEQLALARTEAIDHKLKQALAALAQEFSVYLVAGSMPLLVQNEDKFTNSCLVFSPKGEQVGDYDKLHLFDVDVQDNEKNYRESAYTKAGNSLSIVDVGHAKLGLSICYDLRFPELFRQLTVAGADIISVPSAFTRVTGAAHWQTLLQARAIENQVYIVAAGQEGIHENGRETWGHSMIISPWGEILAQMNTGSGMICADYEPKEIANVRSAIPVALHNRFKNKLMSNE